MALVPFDLIVKGTQDTNGTPFQVGNAMIATSWVRIRNGYIQKNGGCSHLSETAFAGTGTAIRPIVDQLNTGYVALGTTTNLYLYSGVSHATQTDITPMAGVGSGNWYLNSWGQNLLAVPAGGTIYQWVPPISGGNIAAALSNAPSMCAGLIVAAPQQQIIAWGIYSLATTYQDYMLIGWCDVGNNTVWTAAANNQAGTFRIPTGSYIHQVSWFGLSGLIWTDLDLWAMTYVGYPLVYGFNKIAPNCGMIGPRAAGTLGTRTAWMSQNDFFAFQGGQVQPIECSVRSAVFENLDRNYLGNIICCTNAYNGEFMWRFPITGSGGLPTAYAKWSPNEQSAWDYGTVGPTITAWFDESYLGAAIGADVRGYIQQFEVATDNDGVAIPSGFTTGWFAIAEGQQFVSLETILPDFVLSSGASLTMSINFADYLPATATDFPVRTYGPYTVDATTPFIVVEGRGRFAQLVVSMSGTGFWRYGKPPAMIQPDGSL